MKDIQDALAEFGKSLAEIAQPIAEALERMTPEQRLIVEFMAENPKIAEAFQELNQKLARKKTIDTERVNELIDKIHPEPLIKDEKIRKAVRAWAEANKINKCRCSDETHCITFETERGMFISFENADHIPPEGNFTIAELCGEEEE